MLLLIVLVAGNTQGQSAAYSKDSLLADCDSLQKYLKTHPDVNWLQPGTDKAIENGLNRLRKKIELQKDIDSTSINFLKIDVLKIVALLGDGHSQLRQMEQSFGSLPISLFCMEDGYFVVAAGEENASLLGAQLTGIGKYTLQECLSKIKVVSCGSNNQAMKAQSNGLLTRPGILYSLGIAEDQSEIPFHFKMPDGQEKTILLKSVKQRPKMLTYMAYNKIPLPLFLQNRDRSYWYSLLPDGQTVYMALNAISNMQALPFAAFTTQLDSFLKVKHVQRLIIDARLCGGGDNFLNAHLIKLIQSNPTINKKGNLFLVTGYYTFSAAINLYGDVENCTQATIVGEPVGDAMHFPGDPKQFKLNGFGLSLAVSQFLWETTFDWDKRIQSRVDIPVAMHFSNYKVGKDEIIEKILSLPLPKPSSIPALNNLAVGRYNANGECVEVKKNAEGWYEVIFPGKMYLRITGKQGNEMITSNPFIRITDSRSPTIKYLYNSKPVLTSLAKTESTSRIFFSEKKQWETVPISMHGNNLAQRAYKIFMWEPEDNYTPKALLNLALKIGVNSEVAGRLLSRLK